MKTITSEQCKGARGMLDVSRKSLSEMAGVAERTLTDFERGARTPHPSTLQAICIALETAGVEFIAENGGGAGVRLSKSTETALESE